MGELDKSRDSDFRGYLGNASSTFGVYVREREVPTIASMRFCIKEDSKITHLVS